MDREAEGDPVTLLYYCKRCDLTTRTPDHVCIEIRPPETVHDRNRPVKSWGWEEWIVNNEWYCGKRLHFTVKGGRTSLHFHSHKHETMYVEQGSFMITLVDTTTGAERVYTMEVGQSLVIDRNVPHRIEALELVQRREGETAAAILVEFSTRHEDTDSYRVTR